MIAAARITTLSFMLLAPALALASEPMLPITPKGIVGTWEAILWNETVQAVVRLEVDSSAAGYLSIGFGPKSDQWTYRLNRIAVAQDGGLQIAGVSSDGSTIELEGRGGGNRDLGCLVLEGDIRISSLSFHEANRLVFFASPSGREVAGVCTKAKNLAATVQTLRKKNTAPVAHP